MLTLGDTDRLGGIVPGVVVMGIFDKLKGAIVGAFEELGERLANAMADWASWGIETMLRILGSDLLPGPEVLLKGPASILLGASFGLAVTLLRLFIAVATVITIIAVMRRKRTEFAGGVVSATAWLLAWLLLFFPVYTALLSLLQALCKASLAASADASGTELNELSTALLVLLLPNNLALTFIAGLINGLVATGLVIQLAAIVIAGMTLSLLYPLNIALRPLGIIGLNQFRLATAAMITVPVSIFVMVFLLSLELVFIRIANDVVPFLGGFASLAFSIIFGIALLAAPYVVFAVAYTKVEERFGSADAKIQSGIDVLTMPDINSRQIADESNRDRLQYVREFATELPAAIASGENSPGTEAKELAKQIGIKAAAASTNPYVAAAATAYTGLKVVGKFVESRKQDGGET